MIIGYNYLDLHGYICGVQNQSNYLLTKYSNIYYSLAEIDTLYSSSEIAAVYKMGEIIGLYNVMEIVGLHLSALMSE